MLTSQQKTQILRMDAFNTTQGVIANTVGVSTHSVGLVVNNYKRVLVIGDSHCGHNAGLTPPEWQETDQQEEIWNWYAKTVKMLRADALFCMGDMIDGKGKKSGGTELIENTWTGQIKMAAEAIRTTGCSNITMVYGTPFHTGAEEDYELMLADMVGARIHSHAFPIVNGIQFDLKHKIGSSTIQHGRATAIKRAKLWNTVWNERNEQQPKADVILRGHVHYHEYAGNPAYLAMTCPALAGWGSKYGERQCEGIVDTGIVWFDVRDGDTLQTLPWYADIPEFASHKVKTYQI